MIDPILQVARHPDFDLDHLGVEGSNTLPFGRFKTVRQYAADRGMYEGLILCVYDFAQHGGAIGAIDLDTVVSGRPLGATLPINAIVYDGFVAVKTAFVGATATIALGTSAGSTAASLLAATAVASFAAGAVLPLIPLGHGTGEVQMTAEGKVQVTIATAALTAGKALIGLRVIGV